MNVKTDTMPDDDFRIRDNWVEYSAKKANLRYLCYEIEVVNPETGEQTIAFKAIKLMRIIRLPKSAKQSVSLMSMQQQVLSSCYELGTNFITIIANFIQPALGTLFFYGCQGIADNIEDAKNYADEALEGLKTAIQGTYRTMEFRMADKQETEWLREKMRSMDALTVIKGIPKPNQAPADAGNKGAGGKNLNPESQETLEELIAGMIEHEYILQILSTPVFTNTLQNLVTQTEAQMTYWYSYLQGNTSISFNMALPMMMSSNSASSEGWSRNYSSAESVNYSAGESYNVGQSENIGQSFNFSHGQSVGEALSQNFSQSHNVSNSHSWGNTVGESFGENQNVSFGQTIGQTIGQTLGQTAGHTIGQTDGQTMGQSYGQSQGMSQGVSVGQSIGHSLNQSQSTSFTQGNAINASHSSGSSQSVSSSNSQSMNETIGQSSGYTQGRALSNQYSYGTAQSQTVGNSFGTSTQASQSQSSSYNWSESLNKGQSNSQSFSQNASLSYGHGDSSGKATSLSEVIGNALSNTKNSGISGGLQGILQLSGGGSNSGTISNSMSVNGSDNIGNTGNIGFSQSFGNSSSQSSNVSQSTGHSLGNSSSTTTGVGTSESVSMSQGLSQNESYSSGITDSYGVSNSNSHSYGIGSSQTVGTSSSVNQSASEGWSESLSYGNSSGISIGESQSENISQNMSANQSSNMSISDSSAHSLSESQSLSDSMSASRSDSESFSQTVSQGNSHSISQSLSENVSRGVTDGVSVGNGYSQNASESVSESAGSSSSQGSSVSRGVSTSEGTSTSRSSGNGVSGGYSYGQGMSMGLSPSIGYNRSHQWIDQGVKDILELLQFKNERFKKSLRGVGAFYTYVYFACQRKSLAAAMAIAKSTWQNENALVEPLQVLSLSRFEQEHLLHHFNAFSGDVTRENCYGISQAKYSSILLPEEFVAYTHPPRITVGGVFADIDDVPIFNVTAGMKGEIYIGTQLSASVYGFDTGYSTPFDYRFEESRIMHGIFSGGSRTGKTVAAMRTVAEMAHITRKSTGKKLRLFIMDQKRDWRGIARYIEPNRFRFFSMGTASFHPLHLNIWKIPKNVEPQQYIDGIIDLWCRSYGLLIRGRLIFAKPVYELYKEAGVFDAFEQPGWEDTVPKLSSQVTFPKIYERLVKIQNTPIVQADGRKAYTSNDTRDAYDRIIERLEMFSRPYSVETKLYGQEDGLSIDELLGDDEITVLEADGLDKTFANFLFGCITSGIFKIAKTYENGFLNPQQYETLFVIEEANAVLKGNDTAGSTSGNTAEYAGEAEFELICDQAAGLGLFIWAITQDISAMPKSLVQNASVLFAFRQTDEKCKQILLTKMGKEYRYDDRPEYKFISKMPIGWCIAHSTRTLSRQGSNAEQQQGI